MESGELEPKTIRMVDSLRRFGGRFSDLDVVAVTPRMGAPLESSTRRRLTELDVRLVRIRPQTRYVWHHYMNKAQAVMAVEERVDSEAILWMDSDIIFLREPNELELPDGDRLRRERAGHRPDRLLRFRRSSRRVLVALRGAHRA